MAGVPSCNRAAPIAGQQHARGALLLEPTEGCSSGAQYLGPSCSSLHVAGQTLTNILRWLEEPLRHPVVGLGGQDRDAQIDEAST